MSDTETDVTDLYGKEVQHRFDIEFIDLTHTGSADARENQVVILTIPEQLLSSLRTAYRREDPHGISNFEKVRNDDGTVSLYIGGSYGAKSLLGAVGELLYYSEVL